MIKKSVLFICLAIIGTMLVGQSNELLIEQLKTQVNKAHFTHGQEKALTLAIMGYDYIAPGDAQLQQLLYETYYNTSAEEEYYEDESYEDSFNTSDWSPNGQQLAIAVSDGSIRLYNSPFTSYTVLHKTADAGMLDVDFSPDGKQIAYANISGEVGILTIATGDVSQTWSHTDYIRSLEWSHNGQKLAAAGDENMLYIYDSQSGRRLNTFVGHSDWIRNISWSADDNMVATASDDGTAKVWSMESEELLNTYAEHTDYCRDVVFAPKGNALVTTSDDLSAYLYDNAMDVSSSKDLGGHEEWIMAVDWSKDGKYIATADNGGTIVLNSTRTGEQTYYNSVEMDIAWVDIDFSSNNRQFVATSGSEVSIYEVGSSRPITRIKVSGGQGDVSTDENAFEEILNDLLPSASRLYFSPDKSKLGLINASYELDVIDMNTGRVIYSITEHEDWIRNISWSKNGQYLATASDDMMVGVWGAETGEMIHFLNGHTDWVRDVDFAPDSKTLLSAGDDGVVRAWDVSTGDELSVTDKNENFLMTVDWSPRQGHFATQDSEGFLSIWQSSNNKLLFKSNGNTQEGSVKWTDDKNLTVVSEEGDMFTWNADVGMSMSNNAIAAKSSKGVNASAKGPYISISGSGQNAFLEGHISSVLGMEWSPDGSYLVSYSVNNMGIWEPSKGHMIAMIPTVGVFGKEIIWLSDNKSFFVAGSPKITLPASSIRQNIEEEASFLSISKEDVIAYNLEKIFLSKESVTRVIMQKANAETLMAFAEFYEERADSRQKGTAKASDEQKGKMFRDAAENK